jgi:hypothetical protein
MAKQLLHNNGELGVNFGIVWSFQKNRTYYCLVHLPFFWAKCISKLSLPVFENLYSDVSLCLGKNPIIMIWVFYCMLEVYH